MATESGTEGVLTGNLAELSRFGTDAEVAEVARLLPYVTGPPDAARYFARAGLRPDPWQSAVLTSPAPRLILLCSRQSGKSQTVGALAMHTAEYSPKSLVLMGAPSQNQSAELLRKAMAVYSMGRDIKEPTEQESVLRVTLGNGARVICVPGRAGTVRSYSAVKLLVVDEAAYVPDDFYQAVLPMLAVSRGRVVLLSTPHVKDGAFWKIWSEAPEFDPAIPAEDQPTAWLKIKVTWRDCPRITEQFVMEYRDTYGDHAYRREFEVEFLEGEYSVFTREEVDAMSDPSMETWEW